MAPAPHPVASTQGLITCLGLLTLLFTIAGVSGGPANLRGTGQVEQVLVFDAGSSGTRIHVFNILPAEDPSRAHVPRIDLAVRSRQTLKVRPGLSSFAERGDFLGAQRNIQQLIDFADQFVPMSRRATTPALLKATAGLRAVSATSAQAVLDGIRETLATTGYRFRPEWADIIQGKEEGGLAWVAANYLRGTFGEADQASVGVIEMGGGSTQVTFQVGDSDRVEGPDNFSFQTLQGRRYRVYAHSYLGYGQDHAQALLRDLMPASVAEDPCYPQGYHRKGPLGSSALVRGAGDADRCRANIRSMLLAASEDAPGQYDFELPLMGSFVATENFFYVQDSLALKLEDVVVELPRLEQAAASSCTAAVRLSSEELAKLEAGTADAGSPNSCFALSYQALLLQALQVPLRHVEVRIAHKINGGDVDWALGAALVHFLQGHAATSSGEASGFHLVSLHWLLVLVLAALAATLVARTALSSACGRHTFAQVTGMKPTKLGATSHPVE